MYRLELATNLYRLELNTNLYRLKLIREVCPIRAMLPADDAMLLSIVRSTISDNELQPRDAQGGFYGHSNSVICREDWYACALWHASAF